MNPFMLLLAVLPAVILFAYIYHKDTIEKEPPGLLVSLFLLGAVTVVTALVTELVLSAILSLFLSENSVVYHAIDNFVLVALTEEAGKYVVLRLRTWNSPHFNYTFDAIVYSVVVSLGFATLENIAYLMDGSLTTAIARAILSVPGHAIDGVFMGYFFGLAKRAERMGDARRRSMNLQLALLAPVIIHGLYDFYISTELLLVFLLFEIVITTIAIIHIRRLSKENTHL